MGLYGRREKEVIGCRTIVLEWMPGSRFCWHSRAVGPAPLSTGVRLRRRHENNCLHSQTLWSSGRYLGLRHSLGGLRECEKLQGGVASGRGVYQDCGPVGRV